MRGGRCGCWYLWRCMPRAVTEKLKTFATIARRLRHAKKPLPHGPRNRPRRAGSETLDTMRY
jgi:hypothetical protein